MFYFVISVYSLDSVEHICIATPVALGIVSKYISILLEVSDLRNV